MGKGHNKLHPNNNNNNQLAKESRLERRLDRLEFELRKSVHLMRANLASTAATTNLQQQSQLEPDKEEGQQELKTNNLDSLADISNSWASLTSRLELVEKFVAAAATKVSLN